MAESESDPWIIGDMAQMVQKVPPEVQWLVKGLIPVGAPGFFAARAGAGKSMTSLHVALSLTSGRGVLGQAVSQEAARGVLYVSMEDDLDDFWRRVHNGMALLREDLNWTTEDEQQIKARLVPIFPKRLTCKNFRLEAQWKSLSRKALNIPGGCGLIVLDTFARLSGGDENSAQATRPFLDAQAALAAATGAAVMAIHHIGKGNATVGNKDLWGRLHPETLRGSSAIEASARFILTMASLNLAEAERAGLNLDQARREDYVALSLAKISQGEKGATLLLERRPNGVAGAGFLVPHPESERVLALLKNGQPANKKLTLQEKVLVAICKAGSLTDMDQDAAALELWPEAEKPLGQWQKHLTGLRKQGWLLDQDLTAAGIAHAETLGHIPAQKGSDGGIMGPNNVTPLLPSGSGD